MTRPVALWLLVALTIVTGVAPYWGPSLTNFEGMWLFWIVCPLAFIFLAATTFFASGNRPWTLLLWILAPICLWYPGQILIMILIGMLNRGEMLP
jgi:hypothetical protein